MKIEVPRLVQDRLYLFSESQDVLLARPTDFVVIDGAGPFLDGPVSPRIAVVDIDASSGELRPPSRFVARSGRVDGGYELDDALLDPDPDPLKLEDTAFVQQSVFATSYGTLKFFEGLMGRSIEWAFGRRQLLIVPRAGELRNAFYERESGSLQFFEYRTVSRPDRKRARTRTILTALSHDIVVHETTHAILDGIAPDLYDAIAPESLALHESIADLSAILQTLLNDMVVWSILNISSSVLDTYEVLGRVAEEFGYDPRRAEGADFLRSADNRLALPGAAPGSDVVTADYHSPHDCSQVLTGAVFAVYRRHAESLSGDTEKKIRRAALNLSRLLVPALDLLPPGEATFADYARAIGAQARVSGGGHKLARWLAAELARRGADAGAHGDDPRDALAALPDTTAAALRRYGRQHRAVLGIPPRARFTVSSIQRTLPTGGKKTAREQTIVRFRWLLGEAHEVGRGLSGDWEVATGVTIAFATATGAPLAVVTAGGAGAGTARGRQLRHWMGEGLLFEAGETAGSGVSVHRAGGRFRVAASARTLHVVD